VLAGGHRRAAKSTKPELYTCNRLESIWKRCAILSKYVAGAFQLTTVRLCKRVYPAGVIARQAAGGDDAVNVGMMLQLLIPRVMR
jgi:hypothetical protein